MILWLTLFAQVTLAQAQSFAFDLPAGVADATPLFGPVREREWSPDWAPRFIHPADPAQREGAVFTTATHNGTRLWVLTERANDQVHALTAQWAAEEGHYWGVAIASALKRSAGRE